jgi:GNAT superfamily N-acetyltransferase
MRTKSLHNPKLIIQPLDKNHWNDFETLFGSRGACGGCWCMSWRLPRREFEKQKGEGNKQAMKRLVKKKEQIGFLAYADDKIVGWCAVAPRERYVRLETSRVLKRLDNESVWSIPCFFLAKQYRRKGLSVELLKAVIAYCKKKGVKTLEGYPIIPYSNTIPAAFAWTGFLSSFEKAGFKEAKRWSKARPIMRYYLCSHYSPDGKNVRRKFDTFSQML